jgi:hypothetical protein
LLNLAVSLILTYIYNKGAKLSLHDSSLRRTWSPGNFVSNYGGTVWLSSDSAGPDSISDGLRALGITALNYTGSFDQILATSTHSPTPVYLKESSGINPALTIFFNTSFETLPAAAANLVSNIRLKQAGEAGGVQITAKYDSLPKYLLKISRGRPALVLIANLMMVEAFVSLPTRMCLSIVHERETDIRTNLRMNGVRFVNYYIPYMVAHWIFMVALYAAVGKSDLPLFCKPGITENF